MKKTILLVDDEINILDIQNRYLIQAGYDVLVAHDGKEGLELFRKKYCTARTLTQNGHPGFWAA